MSSGQLLRERGECAVGVRSWQLLSGGVEPELCVCSWALLREHQLADGLRGRLVLSCRLDWRGEVWGRLLLSSPCLGDAVSARLLLSGRLGERDRL
jgi:hypothetical protein